jgi:hypothetical protein
MKLETVVQMVCSAVCVRFVLCNVPLYTVLYCYFVLVTTAKLYIGCCLQVLACSFFVVNHIIYVVPYLQM